MTMPAHKYLSQLGHGEVVVASCFSQILVSHKGKTYITMTPEFNATCCTLGHLISTSELQILPEDMLFYKEDKDGEFNVFMHHQTVQQLCFPNEGMQLNLTSPLQMHAVGLGNKNMISILFHVRISRHHDWVIWDLKPSTSMSILHQKWTSRVDSKTRVSLDVISPKNESLIKNVHTRNWFVSDLMSQFKPGMYICVKTHTDLD